ncbi:PQQ-dependent sugar dehydrogenase [Rufibacter glacialis]|uniref:PQQ-dependent sugar dehydrogenase n=1 Tax=Rufibacter glacialis TaxID=1259555 RepID=A0A5M8QHW7_9BACT|nr:PQQ-dependent sugar dehydrogenase [Rufibacter glacialis]KAA6434828.1 PQQ-dependent sugar dehydrogenase [Rufibacter glacialis]
MKQLVNLALVAFTLAGAACSQKDNQQEETPSPNPVGSCTPLENRTANAPAQKPAFAGQTRACGITSGVALNVTVLAKGLENPWAVEPLPDGSLLVTEKPGRLRLISPTGEVGPPISGLPQVDARGQGGLLDVALSPTFSSDRTIFWSFSEPRTGGNGTSVARGVLSPDRRSLEQVRVIFRALPTYNGTMHYGSRLAFGPDNMLYVTLGERSDLAVRPQAQHLNSHMGKILRLTPDGTPAPGNPFISEAGALPEIWTLGHRNVQAAAFDQEGKLWIVEMGPQGGDELNQLEKGKNYGWPLVTYGQEYSGNPVPNSVTAKAGFEQPVYYWDPVIAPSGAQFYTGAAFPEWQGNLLVGSLKDRRLVRLKIEKGRVTGEEHLLTDRGQRIRDVRQGPDGALYLVTDQANGELWKITPQR